MSALSDLLQSARGDRSVDQLIDAANKRGVEVSTTARSNVYKALAGSHPKQPKDRTLRLWAEIFGLKVTDLRKALGQPAGELGPWVPIDEAAQLSQPIRDALDGLIKAIVKQGGEADGDATPTRATGPVVKADVVWSDHPLALRLLEESAVDGVWRPREALRLVSSQPDSAVVAEAADVIRGLVDVSADGLVAARRSVVWPPGGRPDDLGEDGV